jgi:quercetin dioxygenase-like cupin family protein
LLASRSTLKSVLSRRVQWVDQQLLLASLSQAESPPHWLAVVFSPRTSTNFTPVTREVYAAPGADKKSLLNEPLHGVEGQQVTIDHYSLPPAWIGGKHYHTGPVYVYVLEGAFNVDEQGKPRQTFKAGEVYPEPIGVPMQTRNISTSDPLRLLVIQITPKGEPLMYKAE